MTSSTPDLPPAPRPARWALFVFIMSALIALLLWNNATLDSALWRATRWAFGNQDRYVWTADPSPDAPWYLTTPPPFNGRLFSRVERIVWVFRDFGEYWMTLILIAGVALLHPRRCRAAVVVLFSTALTSGCGALLAAAAGRLRPSGTIFKTMENNSAFPFLYHGNGEIRNAGYNVWRFLRGLPGGSGGGDLSFPSGHATLAFATAAALMFYFPRGRPLFLIVATGCALSRVLLGAHFYSDILAGAMIGLTLGTLLTHLGDRFLNRPVSRHSGIRLDASKML